MRPSLLAYPDTACPDTVGASDSNCVRRLCACESMQLAVQLTVRISLVCRQCS